VLKSSGQCRKKGSSFHLALGASVMELSPQPMASWIWSKGVVIAADELHISPFDRGLTVGLGLFETILVRSGQPVFLAQHLARHALGCKRLGWQELDPGWVEKGIREVLKANQLTRGSARVRLFQTAGVGPLAQLPQGPGALTLITAAPLTAPPEQLTLTLTLSPWLRNDRSPLSGLKCASYAENLLALAAAAATGFDEPLFLNTRDEVCETATANLFLIKDGTLRTPPLSSGCLPGISRALVLQLAQIHGLPIEEITLHLHDLQAADELFLTSALRGIVPVSRLDARQFSAGIITSRLRHALVEWSESPA
jgi:branched-chain amino acid aminotransferase